MAKYTIDNTLGHIDFECNNDHTKRVLQNCKNLISCRMGEVPYDRKRGLDPALFDMGIEEMNGQLMPEIDRVLAWEPDAEAVSAQATISEDGETVITVIVDVAEQGGYNG